MKLIEKGLQIIVLYPIREGHQWDVIDRPIWTENKTLKSHHGPQPRIKIPFTSE